MSLGLVCVGVSSGRSPRVGDGAGGGRDVGGGAGGGRVDDARGRERTAGTTDTLEPAPASTGGRGGTEGAAAAAYGCTGDAAPEFEYVERDEICDKLV